MQNVFQARTPTKAAVVRNLLEDNGIAATLVEQTPSFSGIQCSEVWISHDEDRDRAVLLVRELYVRSSEDSFWACPKCRESNPDSFDLCWQCSAPRPGR